MISANRLCLPVMVLTVLFFFMLMALPGSSGTQQPPMKTIRAVVAPYLAYGPYFIAQDEGYFRDQGLEVEFVRIKGTVKAIPALVQGQVDILAGIIYPGYFNAIQQGASIRMVASRGTVSSSDCTSYGYLARKELVESKALDAPQGLKGVRVATDGPSSSSNYLLEKLLASQGLSIADVETIPISGPNRIGAFASDAVDLTSIKEPFLTRIADDGHAVIWKSVAEIAPDYQDAVIFYGPNLLLRDPEAGRTFLAAYLQGVRQFNLGPTERNLDIVSSHTGLEIEFLKRCCWPSIPSDGKINIPSVLEIQEWFDHNGHIEEQLPIEKFWEPMFIEQALTLLNNQRAGFHAGH